MEEDWAATALKATKLSLSQLPCNREMPTLPRKKLPQPARL